MKIFKIDGNGDFGNLCKDINPQTVGLNIMEKKSKLNFFYIKELKRAAANILKQDALSIGAELVTSKDSILGGSELENALLIATDKQIESLRKKEMVQDFGLKKLAQFLNNNFEKPKSPEIMGVLNFNTDSFNPNSRTKIDDCIQRATQMISDGATYIDIGMVSSRPGSIYPGSEEEFRRVKPVIDLLFKEGLLCKAKFSLDSYDENCIAYALEHGFAMVNDITANCSLGALANKFGAEYCLMHMNGEPQTMQNNVEDCDILSVVDEFFQKKLEICDKFGVKNIFLDVGIGFGKTAHDNMILIRHLEHFLHFGHPLLIGASRKSVINFYHPSDVKDRLAGTLFLHLKAYENGAKIIRVHDVFEHVQMFRINDVYKKLGI